VYYILEYSVLKCSSSALFCGYKGNVAVVTYAS